MVYTWLPTYLYSHSYFLPHPWSSPPFRNWSVTKLAWKPLFFLTPKRQTCFLAYSTLISTSGQLNQYRHCGVLPCAATAYCSIYHQSCQSVYFTLDLKVYVLACLLIWHVCTSQAWSRQHGYLGGSVCL